VPDRWFGVSQPNDSSLRLSRNLMLLRVTGISPPASRTGHLRPRGPRAIYRHSSGSPSRTRRGDSIGKSESALELLLRVSAARQGRSRTPGILADLGSNYRPGIWLRRAYHHSTPRGIILLARVVWRFIFAKTELTVSLRLAWIRFRHLRLFPGECHAIIELTRRTQGLQQISFDAILTFSADHNDRSMRDAELGTHQVTRDRVRYSKIYVTRTFERTVPGVRQLMSKIEYASWGFALPIVGTLTATFSPNLQSLLETSLMPFIIVIDPVARYGAADLCPDQHVVVERATGCGTGRQIRCRPPVCLNMPHGRPPRYRSRFVRSLDLGGRGRRRSWIPEPDPIAARRGVRACQSDPAGELRDGRGRSP